MGISAELRLFKVHEPLGTEILAKKLKKGMVVIDIGSNIGYNIFLESKLVGSKGRVIAVEPDPVSFTYLLRNIELNNLLNVEPVNKAISSRDGTVKMIRSNRSNWSRVLQKNQDLASTDMTSVIQVQALTLTSLIKGLGLKRVDLIRMDVEGYEDHIIGASRNEIKKHLPNLLIEIHQFIIGRERFMSLLSKLDNMGYDTKYIIPRNIDFALIRRSDDVKIRSISQLVRRPAPDVFCAYITPNLD